MKEHLSMKEDALYICDAVRSKFFGAGNLIFPVYLGHMAGGNVWRAAAGFLITGVGLPLLGVAALGVSRSGGLLELSSRVGEKYGYFFTCALYMTIGPLFAIPRCATVSFTVGAAPLLGAGRRRAAARCLLALLLRRRARLFAQPRQDTHVGRQGAHACLSHLPRRDDGRGARLALV